MKNYIGVLAAIVGVLILIGTAGSSDAGTISAGQAGLQALLGIALFGGGVIGTQAAERHERSKNNEHNHH